MSARWPPRIARGGSGGGGAVVLAGDATGPSGANTVEGIQNNAVDAAPPSLGDTFVYDGAQWTFQPAAAAGSVIVSASGQFTVPAGVAVGDVVYITGSLAADQADNTSVATAPAVGIVVAKPLATTATVAYLGEVAGFVGLTAGAVYYLGTLGGMTTTPPNVGGNVIQRIGVAISATALLLNPSLADVVI